MAIHRYFGHSFDFSILWSGPLFFYLGQCDLKEIPLPENANQWSCNEAINEQMVMQGTKCELICPDGYDVINGKHEFSLTT